MSRRMRKPSANVRRRLETAKAQDWRRKRFKKQEGLCAYCSVPMVMEPANSRRAATLDHVVPRSRGGEHHWENVVCACLTCNHEKGDQTAEEYLARRDAAVLALAASQVDKLIAAPDLYSEDLW